MSRLFKTKTLPVTVERLYNGDLLLAGGRPHEHWRPHNSHNGETKKWWGYKKTVSSTKVPTYLPTAAIKVTLSEK